MTSDEVGDRLSRAGRAHGPAILYELWTDGEITTAELRDHLVPVWSMVEHPLRALPRRVWLSWFRVLTFPKPVIPRGGLVIFRGAIPAKARGMSWTTDPERAQWFADRCVSIGAPAAHVYTVGAPRRAVLADVDAIEGEGGRGEREIIIDPDQLPRVTRFKRSVALERSR